MAFKFAVLAAVCIAQAFAFQPLDFARACKDSATEITVDFDKTVSEIDGVRETVSMAAMDAYSQKTDLKVIVLCYAANKDKYEALGKKIADMMRDATEEMNEALTETAEKYAKLMEAPIKTIAVTIRSLPEIVGNYIKNNQYLKALEAVMKARRVIEDNSLILANIMKEMAAEVPPMADRLQEMAREIREEARKGAEEVNEAFRQCVKAGGPQ